MRAHLSRSIVIASLAVAALACSSSSGSISSDGEGVTNTSARTVVEPPYFADLGALSAASRAIVVGEVQEGLGFEELTRQTPDGEGTEPRGVGYATYEFAVESVLAVSDLLESTLEAGQTIVVGTGALAPGASARARYGGELEAFSKGIEMGDHLVLYVNEYQLPSSSRVYAIVGSDYGILDVVGGTGVARAPEAPLQGQVVALDDAEGLGVPLIGSNDASSSHDFTTVPPLEDQALVPRPPQGDPDAVHLIPASGHRDGGRVQVRTAGLEPSTSHALALCANDALERGASRCAGSTRADITTDDAGTLATEVVVRRFLDLDDGTRWDCTSVPAGCRVVLAPVEGWSQPRTAPLDVE